MHQRRALLLITRIEVGPGIEEHPGRLDEEQTAMCRRVQSGPSLRVALIDGMVWASPLESVGSLEGKGEGAQAA